MKQPKILIENILTREFQPVQRVVWAELKDVSGSFFRLGFELCWQNDNVAQQMRRASKSQSGRTRTVLATFYPEDGGKVWRRKFKLEVSACVQKKKVFALMGTVSELEAHERR